MCMLQMKTVLFGIIECIIHYVAICTHVRQLIVKKINIQILQKLSFPGNPYQTGNLLTTLNVKVDATVISTTNVDVSDGLNSGVMGMLSYAVTEEVNGKSTVDVILTAFDIWY